MSVSGRTATVVTSVFVTTTRKATVSPTVTAAAFHGANDLSMPPSGGALPTANLDAINLARPLEDGEQVYLSPRSSAAMAPPAVVPTKTYAAAPPAAGARPVAPPESPRSSSSSDKLRSPGDGTVSINSAGLDELQRLPGVGPATAKAILDYRAQIGRFATPDQRMDVKGIGPKKFEKMRPFVSL